jgi:hypothetical protein
MGFVKGLFFIAVVILGLSVACSTRGDGNWLCDPPVKRSTIVGEVEAFLAGGEWWTVAAPRARFYRRLAGRLSQMRMSLVLELSPPVAIWISHPISRLRMGSQLVLSKLRHYAIGHARS